MHEGVYDLPRDQTHSSRIKPPGPGRAERVVRTTGDEGRITVNFVTIGGYRDEG